MKVMRLLQLILVLAITPALFAQLPDLMDPFFDLSDDVLTPDQVKKYHVKSCTKKSSWTGETQIFYDGNGRVIKRNGDKTFFIYNGFNHILTGHIFEDKWYADEYNYAGNYTIQYDSAGMLSTIQYQLKSGMTEEQSITQLGFKEGKLFTIQTHGHREGILSDDFEDIIFCEFGEDGTLKEVTRNIKHKGVDVTLYYDYSNNQLISKQDGMYVNRYLYNSDGRLTGTESVIKEGYVLFGESAAFKPGLNYEYYDNGLVSKETDSILGSEEEYEYEYISPATVSIMAEGALEYITLFNFSQQYGYEQHTLTNGEATLLVYPPYKELYVFEITPEFKLPVILIPGGEVSLSISPDLITFGEEDEDNTIMFEVEMAKLEAIKPDVADEQNWLNIATVMIEKMEKYPEFIGFLYYTEFWDVQNNKQLFLGYTEKMLEQYPMNFKASEAFVTLRQE